MLSQKRTCKSLLVRGLTSSIHLCLWALLWSLPDGHAISFFLPVQHGAFFICHCFPIFGNISKLLHYCGMHLVEWDSGSWLGLAPIMELAGARSILFGAVLWSTVSKASFIRRPFPSLAIQACHSRFSWILFCFQEKKFPLSFLCNPSLSFCSFSWI